MRSRNRAARRGSARRRHAPPPPVVEAAAAASHGPAPLEALLDLAVLAIAAWYLVALGRQAAPAVLASDECFHAYVAEWIVGHARLPRELPEFYSGLPYFYPPLFHLLGAAVVRLAGVGALPFLNVGLTGALFAAIFALPVPGLPRAARRAALLLCLASASLTLYAARFYAETLASLLAVLVVLMLIRVRARPGPGAGALLGLATGAAVLAKQPAVVLPVLLALLATIDRARGRRASATAMLVALGTAVLVCAPFLVRNAVLFGHPLQPPLASGAQVALDALNTRRFSLPAPAFYRNGLIVMGPLVPWVAAAALVANLVRRRYDLATGLLAGCLAFFLLAPWVPRFQPRHLNPITAMTAVLGCLVVFGALERRRWVCFAVQGLLVLWAAWFVARLGGLRSGLDASPADRAAYRAIAELVPEDGTVLSRLTYDTFYYSRRHATWPVPWGPSGDQLALFGERQADRFLDRLDRLGIDHLLVPRRSAAPRFDGVNYPETFLACVADLVERGRLKVLWASADQVLVGRSR